MSLREKGIVLPGFPRYDKHTIRRNLQFRSKDRNFFKRYRRVYFLSDLKFKLGVDNVKYIPNLECISPAKITNALFLVYYDTDDDYVKALKHIKKHGGHFLCFPIWAPKTKYRYTNKNSLLALNDTFKNKDKVSHWNIDIHETITQVLDMTKDLPGAYVEIGVYKGGSALTALNYCKYAEIKRPIYLLDTFEGFSYKEAVRSFDIHWQGTHKLWGANETMKVLRKKVFNPVGVPYELVRSNICRDQLPAEVKQIAACNIDVDMYDATLAALNKVAPLTIVGSVIICEDPTSTPGLGGALLAMDEFLGTNLGRKFLKVLVSAQYILIRIKE